MPVSSDSWTDVVASGRITLADDHTDLVDEPPEEYDIEASTALAAMREHER